MIYGFVKFDLRLVSLFVGAFVVILSLSLDLVSWNKTE